MKTNMDKTYTAYCITKTYKDGEKVYLREEMKCWTTEPTEAAFYTNLKDATEDLQFILDSHKRACDYYEHTKGTPMNSPKYKIENVSITFLGEIKED